MRTPITLGEFIFTLNQDEDIRVRIIDYERDKALYSGWKSDLMRDEQINDKHIKWFVQDFITTTGGLEIAIVELEEELC